MEVYVVLAGLFLAEGLAVYFWGRARGRALERGQVTAWLTEMAESGQNAQEAEDEARRDSRGSMLDDARDILQDDAEAHHEPPESLPDDSRVVEEDGGLKRPRRGLWWFE